MADPFYVRFNIDIPFDEAEKRFLNRLENQIRRLTQGVNDEARRRGDFCSSLLDPLMISVETALGETHGGFFHDDIGFVAAWRKVLTGDFLTCLHGVEALYRGLK